MSSPELTQALARVYELEQEAVGLRLDRDIVRTENVELHDEATGTHADLRVQHTMNQDLRGIITQMREENAKLRRQRKVARSEARHFLKRAQELLAENARLRRVADGETQALRAEEVRLRQENNRLDEQVQRLAGVIQTVCDENRRLQGTTIPNLVERIGTIAGESADTYRENAQLESVNKHQRLALRELNQDMGTLRERLRQVEGDSNSLLMLRKEIQRLKRTENVALKLFDELQTAQEQLKSCRQHRDLVQKLLNEQRELVRQANNALAEGREVEEDLETQLHQANSPLDFDIRERTARVLLALADDVRAAGK